MFNIEPGTLFLSIVLSFVALGYYSYGKKNSNYYFQVSGGALIVLTFFINDFWPLLGVGALCIALPFILEKF